MAVVPHGDVPTLYYRLWRHLVLVTQRDAVDEMPAEDVSVQPGCNWALALLSPWYLSSPSVSAESVGVQELLRSMLCSGCQKYAILLAPSLAL